jgi:phosphoribosylamine-glycine ligase
LFGPEDPLVKGIYDFSWGHAIKSYSSYRSSKLGAQLEEVKNLLKSFL